MTFSIVARDPATDAVGVAVHSKFVSVSSVVPFDDAEAGAIATQSYANVAYGPDGLALLPDGNDAATVVEVLTEGDEDAPLRQIGVVGQDSSIAAVQAGNDVGGDSRGEQAAALSVVKPEGGYDGRNDRWVDVRVDDHETPIDELERVFKRYDVTLLEREAPDELRELDGKRAKAVTVALADMGFYDGEFSKTFGQAERDALEEFRGVNNFENHDLDVIEDAIARGWRHRGRGRRRQQRGAPDRRDLAGSLAA